MCAEVTTERSVKRSVKRKSSLNFIRLKHSSFDQSFVYVWSKPKNPLLRADNFLFHVQNFLVSSDQYLPGFIQLAHF